MNDRGQPRSEGGPRLADRMLAARRARFVGRGAELDLFARALAADEPPFAVLHLVGPGGIGKTTLLQEFAGVAGRAGRPVVHIDARHMEPLPDHLLAALAQALGVPAGTVTTLAAHWPADGILIIDTVETIAALDAWLRETLLPHLPARALVVLAGRHTPAPAWSSDIEWASLTRVLALRNLPPEESQSYLALRGVDAAYHAQAQAMTHGHPLALSLVADACARSHDAAFNLDHEPDIVRTLLRKLFDEVPSAQHRLALDACATIPAMTEPGWRLRWAATTLMRSSRGWPGSRSSSTGRAACSRTTWRARCCTRTRAGAIPSCVALNARLMAHLYERFQRAQGVEQQRIWFDLIYVQRYNPGMRSFYSWSEVHTVHAQPIEPRDEAAILEMTARHEGAASAVVAAHWLRRQPSAFLSFRDATGDLVAATAEDCAADPALNPALEFMRARGPVRAGEQVSYQRFWMGRDDHQSGRATMNVVAANASAYWTSHPTLAWNFVATADPEHSRRCSPASTSGAHRRPTSRSAATATACSRTIGAPSRSRSGCRPRSNAPRNMTRRLRRCPRRRRCWCCRRPTSPRRCGRRCATTRAATRWIATPCCAHGYCRPSRRAGSHRRIAGAAARGGGHA